MRRRAGQSEDVRFGLAAGWAETTSWVRVSGSNRFYDYFKGKVVLVSKDLNAIRSKARIGDIIQVMTKGESEKSHSMIVGKKTSSEITLYYHTTDTFRTLASFDGAYGKGHGTNTYTVYRM